MKKEVLFHFLYLIPLFILVCLVRRWLTLAVWPFWVGGIIGTVLPYTDHLIYIYFLAPHELSSQRVASYVGQKQVFRAADLLVDTAHERANLIFHTPQFQALFFVLTFLMMTSSNSLLGKGIVLAFSLHLIVDQFRVSSWQKNGLTITLLLLLSFLF